jgi:hypothetical protein
MTAGYDSRPSEDPAALRAHIDRTRQRISEDLDELGEKLNPQNVKAQIKDGVREATIGRVENMARQAGDGLMQTIKDNPLPAAMAGIGLAWLFMNRSGTQSGRGQSELRYSAEARRSGYGDRPYNAEDYRYNAHQSRFSEVAESVKEKAEDVKEKANELVTGAGSTGSRQARKVEDTFFESPLAVAAAAIAAGLAVGLATPETSAERRIMGEASGDIRDKVADVARETGEKVSAVAQRAVDETKNAAREEGLTGDPPENRSNPYL